MSLQTTSIVVFAAILLPVAFAWHIFLSRYLLASLSATLNVMILLLLLQVLGTQYGHYLGGMLLVDFCLSLLLSLLIGLPFLFFRRKGKKQAVS